MPGNRPFTSSESFFAASPMISMFRRTAPGGQLSNVVDGDPQAAGCFLTPSTKTVPLTTSGRSVEPFNVRHLFDADSISL